MWRAQTSRKGWHHMLNAVRQLATESAPLQVPKPPPKSNALRILKILGISLPVATGGVLGYAWYDQDFRIQLQDNIPYAKDVLENILPEITKTTPTAARKQTPEASTSFQKVQEEDTKGLSVENLPSKIASEEKSDKIDPGVVELQKREKEDTADIAALETVIHKLLTNGQILVAEAVRAQMEAASSIRNYTKLLKQAMDDAADAPENDALWEAVTSAQREREQAMLKASERVAESKKCIEKLQDVIQEGKTNRVTQNNPAVLQASSQLNELVKELGIVNVQVRQAETEANVIQKYKELVDKGRKQFQKEIESLVPAAKPGSDKKLSEDELNILIAHACRRIEQLQIQISELQAQERQKLGIALEKQRQEDLTITDISLAEERQHLLDEYEAEKSKLQMEHLVKLETEVRKQLARQAAAHSDHLKEVLAVQEQELNAEFNRELQFRILEEREKFQIEVAGWISRLKGIEAAIEARAATEKLTRSAQNLWLACIALSSVIKFGGESDEKPLTPLRNSVEIVLKAGNENSFVQLVANSFPDVALDRGVSTEEQLKERFYRVMRICNRLGLVDADNASLYRYLISYLHSLLVFDKVVAASETEEVDLNALDTFALLAYARYWIEKGNLDLAVRFMIQLNGESRQAASDWINEVRLFLESQQIARTLTAYASASGLANTF